LNLFNNLHLRGKQAAQRMLANEKLLMKSPLACSLLGRPE
jgi:hypothetical protein